MRYFDARRALLLGILFLSFATHSAAQSNLASEVATTQTHANTPPAPTAQKDLDEVKQALRDQAEELKRMRALINDQARTIDDLRQRIEQAEHAPAHATRDTLADNTNAQPHINHNSTINNNDSRAATAQQAPPSPPRSRQRGHDVPQQAVPDEQSEASTGASNRTQAPRTGEIIGKQLSDINFSGELRLQYDSFYGLVNPTANEDNPAVLGNRLSSRQRLRVRARLALRGQIGDTFDWGLRLSTGTLPDVTSGNQVLTDFYTHKQFALDQAFLTWRPKRIHGLQLQGGKFDTPWTHTELTFDNDIQPEGLNETYARDFKASKFKSFAFVAWQLPFLERNSVFVRAPDAQTSRILSHRTGRDLALYGAQLRTRYEASKQLSFTLSASDLFFSGTQFITPAQFFGDTVQLPVTVTAPAAPNSPAQTFTGTAAIPRNLLVNGNGNLGVLNFSNNAINRDGHLASGYNLLDFITRLDYTRSRRLPLALILNFVTNTQTRDVVSASSAAGVNLRQRNRESNGYWGELQLGKSEQRGDYFFGYTFIRIEKDAVLTPLNFSDLARQSDVRAQRLAFAYTVDPRVVFSIKAVLTHRTNNLLGVFTPTPPGSLNPTTKRLQFDTTFRF